MMREERDSIDNVLRAMTSSGDPGFRRFSGLGHWDLRREEGSEMLLAMAMVVAGRNRTERGLDRMIDIAFETGSEDALAWICYIVDAPGGDPSPGAVPGGSERYPHPVSPGTALTPEWRVLMQLIQSEDGRTALSLNRNPDGGYTNDTFTVRPHVGYGSASDRSAALDERPNLLFEPTGLGIRWSGGPFEDARANQDVSDGELRSVIRMCAESVMEDFRRCR